MTTILHQQSYGLDVLCDDLNPNWVFGRILLLIYIQSHSFENKSQIFWTGKARDLLSYKRMRRPKVYQVSSIVLTLIVLFLRTSKRFGSTRVSSLHMYYQYYYFFKRHLTTSTVIRSQLGDFFKEYFLIDCLTSLGVKYFS